MTSITARGQDYGHDFVTVGAAGNRAPTLAELPWYAPGNPLPQGVSYEYRITRTEVLTEQWLEFVQAYSPYWTGIHNDVGFTGTFIYDDGGGYGLAGGSERWPIDPSWEMAARYCNWLHNGKVNARWAFENGAYDTSTFTVNPDFTVNHQLTHNPGARFWIPTYDETIKAFYYDVNRYGEGQDGYWLYVNRSQTPGVSGLPENGGTTNVGLGLNYYNAGGYPNVTSPWGLLDTSGGAPEMTETVDGPMYRRRYVLGSSGLAGANTIYFNDRIDRITGLVFDYGYAAGGVDGFRVAAAIPSIPTCTLIGAGMLAFSRRRSL
ncbi:MAG: hypothetical protein U0640_09135 [Phycisphaerales bacterium]